MVYGYVNRCRHLPKRETLHTRLARAYMETGRAEDAQRALVLVWRLYPDNWFAPLGLAVLYAATEQAQPLLADALRLGGDVPRATAGGYRALAPLLAKSAAPPGPDPPYPFRGTPLQRDSL